MDARRILAAGILAAAAAAAAACAPASPTLADAGQDPPLLPIAPPTDTAGFIPAAP
jgi:hypothetical protein